jgi:hypothetical protein
MIERMERLDDDEGNDDLRLYMTEMLAYWKSLEKLLTAEEVAEWIVYSVQLPNDVGSIFLENAVTGHDFMEIANNGGVSLLEEMGIKKPTFRKRIIRQMRTRMVGIGGTPNNVKGFTHNLESCSAIMFSWELSSDDVFPIHTYRVQRRAIRKNGGNKSPKDVMSPNLDYFDASVSSSWTTVYAGQEDDFVDSELAEDHVYTYRIQAWNSVGKSGWEVLELGSVFENCDSAKIAASRGWWGRLVDAIRFVRSSLRYCIALFTLIAGIAFGDKVTGGGHSRLARKLSMVESDEPEEAEDEFLDRGPVQISTKVSKRDRFKQSLLASKNKVKPFRKSFS